MMKAKIVILKEWGYGLNFHEGLLAFTLSMLWMNNHKRPGTSLVAQWLRICLPVQGTRVQSLVREDPTCHRATKPVSHNYWICALEPTRRNYWARVLQLLKPMRLEPVLHGKLQMRSPCTTTKSSPRSPQLEKAHVQQRRHNAAKNK